MIALHAQWTGGALTIWGERIGEGSPGASDVHPFCVTASEWPALLLRLTGRGMDGVEIGSTRVRLPTAGSIPLPSPSLAHASGRGAYAEARAGATLKEWNVTGLRLSAVDVPDILDRLEDEAAREGEEGAEGERILMGDSLRFFAAAGRLARSLIAQQRLVPALVQENGHGSGGLRGVWQPWLHDEATANKIDLLVRAMPPSARAVPDVFEHQAQPIVEDFLTAIVDEWCRRVLVGEQMIEAIEGRDASVDAQVAWLGGLLGDSRAVTLDDAKRPTMVKVVRRWLGGLEDRGVGGEWRLCFRLDEPAFVGTLGDLEAPGADIVWSLTFHLQSVENESILIDAEDVWALRSESATVKGRRIDSPQDLLLKELARAARVCRKLEEPMRESAPLGLELDTKQAYEFLREFRPLLSEQGFGLIVPEWWESPAARIGARLRLDAPETIGESSGAKGPGSTGQAVLGLQALVGYEWQIAVGEAPLTLAEFEKLAASRAPLVRVGGKWVEVRPEDVSAALNFIRENPGGEMRVSDALRLAYRTDPSRTGVPITGLDATGWVATMLEAAGGGASMPILQTPSDFHGDLRPYQARGLSWLAFLDSLGLGPCLADDMGLGKTIQLLALMVHERKRAQEAPGTEGQGATEPVGPTLLVVPMSIVSNWRREAERFAPMLRVLVHHGVDRLTGEAFFNKSIASDLVITTYALAHRDREFLELVPWHRVVLDEAQNIKNPSAKQSIAVRSLPVSRRIVLTGTPLENRLSELWSIMDFCNPGFLGPLGEFRSYFAVPIERYHDKDRSRRLRALVRPFILRRLKTDPTVISDLPAKLETKDYCRLTTEQASLYESCVKEMLTQVDKAEGIRRRGLVLTALIRLKQICNHPAQLPQDSESEAGDTVVAAQPSRSGKCVRLLELLEEVVAEGQQALVFTQFRQMAMLLAGMLRQGLDREVLVLHGGTPQGQRQTIVDRFQKADGSTPILILSLKAGGVGLNLTAASHVFHFDRWWNPAVENQATDRAFRIGQTKTVNVHKFIVGGTLEDRIDQMIESKIALAEDVIGSGEDWLTELTTSQLRDILTLRPEAMADE